MSDYVKFDFCCNFVIIVVFMTWLQSFVVTIQSKFVPLVGRLLAGQQYFTTHGTESFLNFATN